MSGHTRPDIVALLEHWGMDTPTRSSGGWAPVRCGFHDDRSASASVHLDAGRYFCFACGTKGDVYSLIQERERLTFPEALAFGDRLQAAEGQPDSGTTTRFKRAYRPPGRRGRRL